MIFTKKCGTARVWTAEGIYPRSQSKVYTTRCAASIGGCGRGIPYSQSRMEMLQTERMKERPVADEGNRQKLITAFEGQSMKYETYFKLVLATGLRRGEACGIKMGDINWRKRTIHIQRGVVKLSHQESITKDPKTTSGDRMVYLSLKSASYSRRGGKSVNGIGRRSRTKPYLKMTTCSVSLTASR